MKKSNLYFLLALVSLSSLGCGWSASQVLFAFSTIILAISAIGIILDRLSELTKKFETSEADKKLVSFNDALADELMRIRSDLISIRIKQDNLGWDKICNDFLRMSWMYNAYPSSFLCGHIEAPSDCPNPDKYQGKIIIALDREINIDDFWDVRFDAEKLRKINTPKTNTLKKGMNFSVFIGEDKERDSFSTSSRDAKILSIEEDSWRETYYITLEINMRTVFDDLYPSFSKKEDKKIIRKVCIYNRKYYNFLIDTEEENKKNLSFQAVP